jgi:hypothetical protein
MIVELQRQGNPRMQPSANTDKEARAAAAAIANYILSVRAR